MKAKRFVIVVCLLAAAVFPHPTSGAARDKERAVVEKVIRANIGWALTKDRPLLESTMVQDELCAAKTPKGPKMLRLSHPTAGFGRMREAAHASCR